MGRCVLPLATGILVQPSVLFWDVAQIFVGAVCFHQQGVHDRFQVWPEVVAVAEYDEAVTAERIESDHGHHAYIAAGMMVQQLWACRVRGGRSDYGPRQSAEAIPDRGVVSSMLAVSITCLPFQRPLFVYAARNI